MAGKLDFIRVSDILMFQKYKKMKKILFLLVALGFFLPAAVICQAEAEQEITDFYLSNLGREDSGNWEIAGKKALLGGDHINIQTMNANYYFDKDTISVKSDKARVNKKNQDMYLAGNVEIQNKEGWSLKADYLDWQRHKDYLATTSPVETKRDDLLVSAKGLVADSKLERVGFQKEVEVNFSGQNKANATKINCDGPLEIEFNSGKATFKNNVVVQHQQGKLFSDTATLFFDTTENKVLKIVSEGNVRIVMDNNVTLAQKATYLAAEERLVLEGKPRLIYFPQEDQGSSSGFFGID